MRTSETWSSTSTRASLRRFVLFNYASLSHLISCVYIYFKWNFIEYGCRLFIVICHLKYFIHYGLPWFENLFAARQTEESPSQLVLFLEQHGHAHRSGRILFLQLQLRHLLQTHEEVTMRSCDDVRLDDLFLWCN